MKYFAAYIATLFIAFSGISLYIVAQTNLQEDLFSAIIFFFLINLIFGILPFFLNAYKDVSSWSRVLIILGLVLYSALILYYNIVIWALFVVVFILEYYAITKVGSHVIQKDDFPLKYLLNKKGYFKVTIFSWVAFSLLFWMLFMFDSIWFGTIAIVSVV